MHSAMLLLAAIVLTETTALPEARVDFETDIIPILTKAGCNTGACHGAAVGRGGFKLSLYGGVPSDDYRAIVLQLSGRRINLAEPDQSLFLLKPTESIIHGGGYRLDADGEGAAKLLAWIRQGAVYQQRRQLTSIRVSPSSFVVDELGDSLQLSATAFFDDSSSADVTPWTVFTAEDSSAVEIDEETAEAKVLRRGRHVVVARFLNQVTPLEIFMPLADAKVDVTRVERVNLVDDHILQLLSTLHLPPSKAIDDNTFARRLTLDLTGRLPKTDDLQRFIESQGDEKRLNLVDELLASDEFNEYWTLKLAKLLRIHTQPQDTVGAETYHAWLRKQIEDRVGYDQIARDMILAVGDSHEHGPANFYRTVSGPREQAELMSELFMGNRLRCANCHNHPLDRWTQDDYHGLAAIFSKVESGRVIKVNTGGEVTHPRTGEPALLRIPGEEFLDQQVDGRQELADWLTQPDNPFFAKAIVNRLWKSMMGRGLVEPADDLRATNPATHPDLLNELAEDFIAGGYDLRRTLRLIAASAAYSRSSIALPENSSDDRFYSHALRRPLEPEVLADAISDVLLAPDRYGTHPTGTRAVALVDPKTESSALDILGRCSREQTCETSGESTGGLPRKLHLFNGELLNRRLAQPGGRLVTALQSGRTEMEIIGEFYLAALSRPPSAAEQDFWTTQLKLLDSKQDRAKMLEDFVWSLLSCNEFVTNH